MGDNDAETFTNITKAEFDFDDEAFDAISQNAKDFISALLIKRKEYGFTVDIVDVFFLLLITKTENDFAGKDLPPKSV